ncbi:hypothetical protein LOC71_03375 [Rhodopirellula sp. JC740]|uniref:Transmembrane protein n=1 Tax=Rhodopirellula halodulae TaxID=2894198 RepID=A0ABS8NCM5_9BACT|nr:hypothetical protein [Rhodopirellula sp. JC740]MCC9641301.1 hypothetical protein [Rhodopirellula sp. JC740]
MTTASKTTASGNRSHSSRSREKIAPTLLRLPDLDPPIEDQTPEAFEAQDIAAPTSAGQIRMDDPVTESTEAVNPELAIASDEKQAVAATANATPAFSLREASADAAFSPPVAVPNSVTVPNSEPVPKPKPEVIPPEPTRTARERLQGVREATESFGTKALAVAGSRNALLVVLGLLACWAIFAPRRHPNAERDSEALIAKTPPVEQTTANQPATSQANDALVQSGRQMPASSSANDAMAEAMAANPKPNTAVVSNDKRSVEPQPGLNAPRTEQFAGGPSAAAQLGVPTHSAMQSNFGSNSSPIDLPAGFAEGPSSDALPVKQAKPMLNDGDLAGLNALNDQKPVTAFFNPNAVDGATIGQQPVADTPATANAPSAANTPAATQQPSQGAANEMEAAAETSVPVPVQTGTPGPITNWTDYLPPLPGTEEVSDRGATAPVDSEMESDKSFPTTQSPQTPDFQFALPGVAAESTTAPASSSSQQEPEARVAAPANFPDSYLRR